MTPSCISKVAVALAVSASLVACTEDREPNAADYARIACQEWQDYVTSFDGQEIDTSLLPLAEDDAVLAAERDDRYEELRTRLEAAVARVQSGTERLPPREVAAVNDACESAT